MSLLQLDVLDDQERFRASLASVASDGKRKWVYAKKPHGAYYRWRTVVSVFLLAFLAFAPFVKVGGRQFLLFDILERKFVFFGYPIWPEDFYLVVVLFLTGLVSIVVFTAVLGRLWCGWLCPQTVFLEMVFRKIEWWIDGPPGTQRVRDGGGWTADRLWRFAAKQSIYFIISFVIANIFLAYFVSGDVLKQYVRNGPAAHIELFLALSAFTVVFYLVFARFREQACLVVCPYGRFMSALVDDNTVTITYDQKRGEPRTKWLRDDPRSAKAQSASSLRGVTAAAPQPIGDCIDCHQCVVVCPTGIDIRNGIQLECVACTACIDACDEVMEKVKLPKGLIRYTSANAILAGTAKWFTPRIRAYGAIWLVLVLVTSGLFAFRSEIAVNVLRSPGTTWTVTANGVANFYDVQVINKGGSDLDFTLKIVQPKHATITPLGLTSHVPAGQMIKGRFLVTVTEATASLTGNKKIDILLDLVPSDGAAIKHLKTELLTP